MNELIGELKIDEGLRLDSYQDHLGIWTCGYGTNLQTLTITEALAERWLREKVDDLVERAERLPAYMTLNGARKNVILSMMYQMGVRGTMNFKNMWKAIAVDDYETAGAEMRDSQWYRDPKTRSRANRMALRMSSGTWEL